MIYHQTGNGRTMNLKCLLGHKWLLIGAINADDQRHYSWTLINYQCERCNKIYQKKGKGFFADQINEKARNNDKSN